MRTKLKLDLTSVGAILIARNFEGKAKEKGITLVALIITIIVLIILAAVTIITFTETGLLNTAVAGTENYANAQTYEQEIMDNLDKHANKVIANIIGEAGSSESNPENPDVPPTLEEPEIVMPEKWDSTKVYAYKSEDNLVVPIPNGFIVSEVAGEKRVDTGLVIKITQDGITSEFVWVPVANPSEMFGIDKDGNYLGKLYNFSKSGEQTVVTANNWTETEVNEKKVTSWSKSEGGGSYREPDYLTHTTNGDASTTIGRGIEQLKEVVGLTGSNTEILTKWQKQLQNEFKAIKESVEKYNGFYIGRYETGNLSQNKAVVAKENTDIANQNWYVQYQKSKTVVEGKSSMIWGCQWDATLRWFLSSEDEETRNYVMDSTGKGNYSGAQEGGDKAIATGLNDDYSINNIYDMAGNVYDWTIEAYNTNQRVNRRWRLQQ